MFTRHARTTNHARRQAGDTIVEVLISILIIATILTGSFMLARDSSKNVRDAEEHGQALNLLQGQIEALRNCAMATAMGCSQQQKSYMEDATKTFCFKSDPSGEGLPMFTKTAANCKGFGDNQFYNMALKSDGHPTGSMYTFIGTVSWFSVSGGTAQEQLFYRVEVQ